MGEKNNCSNVIEIRDAYKRYSSSIVVFQGLNMTVKKGTIYGLLGPSGCGKTTLLNCIAGISTIDAGTLFVGCHDRRKLGFMPQEAALMGKFKIHELLHYFGKVFGMDDDTIEKRAKELLSLVNLPPNRFYNVYIKALSGGELRRVSLIVAFIHDRELLILDEPTVGLDPITRNNGGELRRVSLIVAFIHDPELLILDEPTVGLDPITRHNLWEYFSKETSNRDKTILITTHYIEEASQTHTVGLMRGGVLLAEAPPEKLLLDYGCDTLEDVFLKLSQVQAASTSENKPYPKVKKPPPPAFTSEKTYCNLDRLIAQIKKNLCWMKRDVWVLALILLLPGVMSFLFSSLHINRLKGLRVALVPEELCTNHTDYLEARCDVNYKTSCLYARNLREMGHIVHEYQDFPSALNAVKKGKAMAVLYFHKNYTRALLEYYDSSIYAPPDNDTLNFYQIEISMDITEKMKARQLKDIIYHAFIDTQQGLLSSCNVTRESTIYGGSRHYIQEVYGSRTGDLTYNALPGFIIPFVFYLATSYTSTAAASERSTGVYCRSLVSGLTKLEIILAHIVVQVMISSVQNCLLMGCLYIIFGSPMEGSFLTALVFIVLTELQGTLFGIFLASLIKSETRLTNVVIGTAMSLFLTSGMIRPVEAMRPILLRVMQYSPIIVAVEAYRSVSRRGWGLDSPKVMSAFTFNAAAVAILVVANIVTAKLNIVK